MSRATIRGAGSSSLWRDHAAQITAAAQLAERAPDGARWTCTGVQLRSGHSPVVYTLTYAHQRFRRMTVARIFKSGNNQAVRLPKKFRSSASEVEICRRGDEIVLKENPQGMAAAFHLLAGMPDDFFAEGRRDDPPKKRNGI